MIRPRTKEERWARIGGYAQATLDIREHGLEFAQNQLRLFAEMEGEAVEEIAETEKISVTEASKE